MNLKDVTVREALDTMREMYGYEYKVQGNRILIEPVTLQTRVFQVNYLLSARKGRSEIRVSSGAMSDTAGAAAGRRRPSARPRRRPRTRALESSKIVTTSDTDFWADIGNAVRAIVGAEGGPQRDRERAVRASCVVRALPAELRQVDEFLNAMQGVVARQVMLEAKIIEVQLKDQFATGINWAAFGEHTRGAASSRRARMLQPAGHAFPRSPRARTTATCCPTRSLPLEHGVARRSSPSEPRGARHRVRARAADQQLRRAARLPRDPGRPAGAVQPAHRDAQQPEGRAQGRHRRVLRHQHHHQPDRHQPAARSRTRRPSQCSRSSPASRST